MSDPHPAAKPSRHPPGVIVWDDGKPRCEWLTGQWTELLGYHDRDWGTRVRRPAGMFEALTLQVFQAGLSWITIFRRREAFRRAFHRFDPATVATLDRADLLDNADIIRNPTKIDATLANAALIAGDPKGFTELVWSFRPEGRPSPKRWKDVPAETPESRGLAKALHDRGFRFVGPTTVYSFMQLDGVVNDHMAGCFRAGPS